MRMICTFKKAGDKIACIDVETKSKKIGARVTPKQKAAVMQKMKESGYKYESEYVLECCLKGLGTGFNSQYQEQMLQSGNKSRLEARVTPQEKELILRRYNESEMKSFSRFVRNCCLDNPIIIIHGLKDFSVELNRIGNNLNQLVMLCHQGMITAPELTEVKEHLKKLYQEVVSIKKNYKLKR